MLNAEQLSIARDACYNMAEDPDIDDAMAQSYENAADYLDELIGLANNDDDI